LRPATPSAASKLLAKYGHSSLVIGGGTEIYELAQRGLLSGIKTLVDLTMLSLNRVRIERDHTTIGASVTLSQLEQQKSLYANGRLGSLQDSLSEIRPLQVKNTATVGGAISSCIPFFDLPVALASLDASVEISGPKRARVAPLVDFQKDFLQPELHRGEFVKGVRIPRTSTSRASAFSKLAQTGDDWAIVNCACSLDLDGDEIGGARIAFGAISNKPFIAMKTAQALQGQKASPDTMRWATEALDEELPEPNADHRASASYRRRMAKVLLGETIKRAVSRGKS
jgi:CO/xanthine dehydrogenase FAD-binding subunit